MDHADAVHVLIVDDTPDLRELIRDELCAKGYSVSTAQDGAEAMTLIEQHQPHCVILDVLMPRVDGYAFAQQLRARHGDDIVLIAMSGYGHEHPQVARTFGIVDHYLQKPFDLAELDKILPSLN
ncbi:MAG TPA: response regulator [Burkholderiaceae bacterium]|jgi:DNA-binding response OmpR family regulator